jgi:hypothetical protein
MVPGIPRHLRLAPVPRDDKGRAALRFLGMTKEGLRSGSSG